MKEKLSPFAISGAQSGFERRADAQCSRRLANG
jgi:hypothetical protein